MINIILYNKFNIIIIIIIIFTIIFYNNFYCYITLLIKSTSYPLNQCKR